MKTKSVMLAAAALSAGMAGAARADDAKVRAALQTLAPGAPVESISPAPVPGFQEVVLGGQVYYVSTDGKYLVQGTLFDIAAKRDLTEARRAEIRHVALKEAGKDRRIVFAAAKPQHTVTVFTDIDCGYCQKLHSQIAEYNARGITVEYLFFPRAGLNSPSFNDAVSVWCAADRKTALTQAKAGKTPPAKTCANPIAEELALGQRVGVTGTPAIFTENGSQIGGYLPPDQMLAQLVALKKAAPAGG